ncbi:MAG: GDSL-type esterase/lipase family protein, partial [Pseudomonadales bacterium]|nr:GDSL-type esterase/lipase family protein [Pseudomonadales bacterium]
SGEGLFGEPPQAISTQVNASNDLITISIGGNDAFFSYILMYCMIHDHCHDIKPFDPFTDIELGELITLYIPIVKQKVVDTFSEIKSKAPNAAILALDYPLILSGNECDRAQFSSDTKLSSEEQAWIRGANQMLNQAIREAAAEVGVHSVSVEEHFEGHGVCGDQGEWIFGTWHFWRKGWFHPNSKGQREYAKVINAYLKSISTGWSEGYFQNGLPRNPQPSVSSSSIELGYASLISTLPNLGDLIVRYDETPTSCENIEPRIAPGMTYTLAGAGFAANESVAITLFAGTQTISLGTLSADDAGVIHGSVLVPSDVTVTSFATIEAMAAGANGLGLLLTINLQMIESITIDTDGDGIFDGCDNCPSIANADQVDDDSDSLGNSCDLCPLDPLNDEDNDGICASVDSCPLDANNDQDGDGFCADEDNCSDIFNPDQLDNEFDLLGNLCDNDDDNDGLLDSVETNTGVYLSGSDTGSDPFRADTDGDGVNDAEEIALNRNPNGEGTLPLVNQVPMPFWMMTLFALAICIFGVRTLSRKA